MESTIESIEQVASDELNKAKTRFVGGRSIDRGNPEDEDTIIQSDDEGMIEEIVTTVEEDKDLECKVKKKIETKKTIAQDPETHHMITKVVKTEVTEITRTITINDQHDLERAKRELGIDDVNRLLPSSSTAYWTDHPRVTTVKETHYEPKNEIVTAKDFPTDSPVKQLHPEEKPVLAESTVVGRGPVAETIVPLPTVSQTKPVEVKKKKKKSKLCSCTRGVDDDNEKDKLVVAPTEQIKTTPSVVPTTPVVNQPTIDTQTQGQQLISADIKQLIIDKKSLLIEYIHSKIFAPSNLYTSSDDDRKARKLSSRILDLLRYDRCQSWSQMSDQLTDEYSNYLSTNFSLQPIVNTYHNLLTTKQSNLLNTFSTIHNENDIQNIHENNDYLKIVQTYFNDHEQQAKPLEAIQQQQATDTHHHALIEKVINADEEQQPLKQTTSTDQMEEHTLPIYNEEHLIKMLADISQHKPITLAEAIAYEYIDLEDPKLGLSNDAVQRIKSLFHPLSDDSISNLIRVKRSGEYITDINLAEMNPFEKFTHTEPFVYRLQSSFEPTLDFSEKQFRSLAEAILNNKDQYDQLEFDVARTSLPVYDAKDASINDVSQSDSGYSMTTATHESLASKIKIEFEPIHHDVPVVPKRDDLHDDEKIDLDKATQEQIDKYELNHEIIQIIKSDFHGSDKTVGQAILSRELRLDSSDPKDIAYLHSLGIYEEQSRILNTLFFPKHSRIIAYSPEPGRFVEAQTTFNPDHAGYKTDTTIIQIQEKQLSSDHLAMQRNIHDDRMSPNLSQQMTESETIVSSPALSTISPIQESAPATVQKEKTPPPPSAAAPSVHAKKRKSSGGLFSCFRSKKPKSGTEQQGSATVKPTILVSEPNSPQEPAKSIVEKTMVDYSITSDGKRIYIDAFRDRPGMDMSYRPDDFEDRFVLPIHKSPSEYERPITPDIEAVVHKSETVKEEASSTPVEVAHEAPLIHSEPEPVEQTTEVHLESPAAIVEQEVEVHEESRVETVEPVSSLSEIVEQDTELHLESRPPTIEPVEVHHEVIEHKVQTHHHHHLEPRPATIEPVDVQPEKTPIVIPSKKSEHKIVVKKPTLDLHGASVQLPPIQLVEPGPLPKLPVTKDKKSTGGLCASCFGAKAAEKKKKKVSATLIPAPVAPKQSVVEEKKDEPSPLIETPPPAPIIRNDEPILPRVNIDTFKERKFDKSYESLPKSQERLETTIEQQYQASSPTTINTDAPISYGSTTAIDSSIFSRVNIDSFRERTFDKSYDSLPKSQERLVATPPAEETRQQLSTTETISLSPKKQTADDSFLHSRVNIDTFKERTFQKSSESLPRSEERLGVMNEQIEPSSLPDKSHDQLLNSEPITSSPSPTPKQQTLESGSVYSRVNIDTFKERTFQKSYESLPKSQERLDTAVSIEEPLYQVPKKESVPPQQKVQSTDNLPDYSKVNIDTFKERSFESRPKSEERLDATPAPPPREEPHYQLPTVQNTDSSSLYSRVNIDTFKERKFDKSYESLPKSQERLNGAAPSEEPHYQLPTNESLPSPPKVRSTNDISIYSQVNIDTFKERTFDKSFESLPKSKERLSSAPASDEPHYQQPTSEPVPLTPSTKSTDSVVKNASIYSQVNIDTFKERTFNKSFESLPKQTTTPVSGTIDGNTYDIPRTVELQQTTPSVEIKTEEQKIDSKQMSPPAIEISKSSEQTETKKKSKSKAKNKSKPVATEKEVKVKSSTSKTSEKKKSSLLSTFFRPGDRRTKVPALDLPPIERDLSPNTQLRQSDSDPLHVPSVQLPKLDFQLPAYERPEVNMASGSIQQSSEFGIPVVDLPPIPDLRLPDVEKQTIDSNIDLMKVPNVQLPDVQYTLNEEDDVKLPEIQFEKTVKTESDPHPTVQAGLALASPVEDMLIIQTDHKNFPIETDYATKTEPIVPIVPTEQPEACIKTEIISIEEKYQVTGLQQAESVVITQTEIKTEYNFQLPSPEPVLSLSENSKTSPPSFDDDVPSTLPNIVPAVQYPSKQLIETKSEVKKIKPSRSAFCSCFGTKSSAAKEKRSHPLMAPHASLPEIEMPIPSSNISSTLKTKGPLHAPSCNLPPVDFTPTATGTARLPGIHIHEKKQKSTHETEAVVPTDQTKQETIVEKATEKETKKESKVNSDIPPSSATEKTTQETTQIKSTSPTSAQKKPSKKEIKPVSTEPKKSASFVLKAPAMNIPDLDLSVPTKSDAYLSLSKQESAPVPELIQSRSDSGLEAIVSSHIHPSSTFGTNATVEDIPQHRSISSGLGSEILDNITAKGYSLPDIQAPEPILVPKSIESTHASKYDFTRKITMNDETHTKLISRRDQMKTSLANEISKSLDGFDVKKDEKSLDEILTHAIDLIQEKKVATYPELKQKLTVEHKNDAFLVDPIVHSLYYAIEKQGLDKLDKPEFPLAIRDMVRLPAKQTHDTVLHLSKEATPLTTTQMTKETPTTPVESTPKPIESTRSCLTCGRSKSKSKPASTTTSSGLVDERRRTQLNTHRNDLSNILRDHIQSSQPPIRKFADHPKESEKIIRKGLVLLTQPKIHSYEQIRNDLKTEHKQSFYLIDPIVDIIRDTLDHCDITQMNEKINTDILDSNISQTAKLYNNQWNLLSTEEGNAFKSNQLSWLEQYLINNESKEKKLTKKQIKELNKILHRNIEILSLNVLNSWDELTSQLQREHPKAHDLCNRSVEIVKQAHRDGLLLLTQAPVQDKRRPSSLISERARQNLKSNRKKIITSFKTFFTDNSPSPAVENHIDNYLNKTFHYLEEQKQGQFKSYQDLKEQLKKDFHKNQQDQLIEQIVDVIEQAHATNQFDDTDKPEVQSLMKDRLNGKPLVLKEMYVSLPARPGAYGTSKYSIEETTRYLSTSITGDQTLNSTTISHRVARGLSWREANERARILFYRGKHPAIHYDEQAAAFDVRMLLETASGGTREIPVTDSDVHELLNSCGVQWDGVNIISLVDHSEDVVRAAEQAALRVIREKGMVDLQTPPSTRNIVTHNHDQNEDSDPKETITSSTTSPSS
ncbi:unnamed protein product [Adineta ricciae]|uniref:Uncharacterized protein n=1 Tax=Adineta ricciae TaxID=249248 RepID=A0A815TBB7_ADIRI|nr:unnamed protein product [Adineta ricciae]